MTTERTERTDVVVAGGGLAGAAVAYYLARAGVEVVLLERGELGREASGTNAGSFHFQIALHQLTTLDAGPARERLLREVRLLLEAADVWLELEEELGGPLDVHVTGGLMVAETGDELRLLVDKQRIEREAGLETHVLTGDELRRLAPYLAEDLAGACYCPREGHANPLLATPLFARRAAERGAQIRTNTAVTGIEPTGGGFSVATTAGPLHARRFVNAAGAWVDELARPVGLELPVRREGLHVNVTEPRARLLEPLIQHIGRRLTLKQSSAGTFIIGGGWPARLDSTVWESAAGNTAVAVRVVPALAGVRLLRTWSGALAFTDDLTPIAGESRRVPGYHVLLATAGFTLSPLLARRLAEQMTGGDPLPAAYSPDRAPAYATRGERWTETT